jgi:hydrogenase maturation protease
MMSPTVKFLVIGYGNPGRLDDGLGPALAESLETTDRPGLTVEADYQLTVEDAAAAAAHDVVIFVDASLSGPEPFFVERVEGRSNPGFTSHGVDPATVIGLARDLFGAEPRGYVVGIRGYEFDEFGESLSEQARANLEAAKEFLTDVLSRQEAAALDRRCEAER